MLSKTEVNGKVDQAKGRVEQVVGKLTGNDTRTAEGQADETVGKVESVVGGAIRKADDATTRIRRAVKR
jgi:uncharacterized protein YjbJ (UPF0337 family)